MFIYYDYDLNGVTIRNSDESDLIVVENKIITPKICVVNSLNNYKVSSHCKAKIK